MKLVPHLLVPPLKRPSWSPGRQLHLGSGSSPRRAARCDDTGVKAEHWSSYIQANTHTLTHIHDVKKSVPQLMGVSRCVPGAQVAGHNTTPPPSLNPFHLSKTALHFSQYTVLLLFFNPVNSYFCEHTLAFG